MRLPTSCDDEKNCQQSSTTNANNCATHERMAPFCQNVQTNTNKWSMPVLGLYKAHSNPTILGLHPTL